MNNHSTPDRGRSADADGFRSARQQMVITQLQQRGIEDPRVLDAMRSVPRHLFVPSALRAAAYEDRPLEIGLGQTISQPFTVAFMAQAARLSGHEKVLEIGTGSGYGAAVLAHLAACVPSVERLPALAQNAKRQLAQLGYKNVSVHQGDGTLGLPAESPFDAILVTAGAPWLPDAYADQLVDGGRLIIPVDQLPHQQAMYCYQKLGDQFTQHFLGNFMFVPLIPHA